MHRRQIYQGNGKGTEPGTVSADTHAQIANMAARPFLEKRQCEIGWMRASFVGQSCFQSKSTY